MYGAETDTSQDRSEKDKKFYNVVLEKNGDRVRNYLSIT